MKNHRYAVVIEKGRTSYGAYAPDLPVCVAVAKSEAGVRKLIREAIAFHIRGLREDGDPVPRPKSVIIEKTKTGFSAYVPDLPSCVATGRTKAQVRPRIYEAAEIHLKSMIADGDPIPQPTSTWEYVEVQLPS